MKKKKLKLNKDTLLVLESRELAAVAAGIIVVAKTPACPPPSQACITNLCTPACPTNNCSLGCPTEPQPLP